MPRPLLVQNMQPYNLLQFPGQFSRTEGMAAAVAVAVAIAIAVAVVA